MDAKETFDAFWRSHCEFMTAPSQQKWKKNQTIWKFVEFWQGHATFKHTEYIPLLVDYLYRCGRSLAPANKVYVNFFHYQRTQGFVY